MRITLEKFETNTVCTNTVFTLKTCWTVQSGSERDFDVKISYAYL